MDLLSKVLIFATQKHQGQLCKGGQPYILHPLAVMNKVSSYEAKVVAIAHDLLEDTNATTNDLLYLGCSNRIILAVIALTKAKGENRIVAAHRASANRLACEVKLADLAHNMDMSRIPEPTQKDIDRMSDYEIVKFILEDAKLNRWNDFLT